jgi:hypothetical protein
VLNASPRTSRYYFDPMRAGHDLQAAVAEHEQRIRALPNEETGALDDEGRVLLAKRGAGSTVTFTAPEAVRMRGAAVFTHNHPAGNSFSPQDVSLACTLQFRELRVVTAQWTHVLRPGPAGWSEKDWSRLDDAGQRAFLVVTDEFQEAIRRRRLSISEANAEFWHCVWERVAEVEGLDYERFVGEQTDAD